jgi:uncharacterized ferredoxin-like protein
MKTRKSDDTYNAETSARCLQNLECKELVGSKSLGFVLILMCKASGSNLCSRVLSVEHEMRGTAIGYLG